MASEDDKEYIELESEGLEEDEADDDGGKKSENITDLFDVVISNPSPADKRAHHNALERKRRDHIKDSFVNLRECVPGISSDKASRAHILKKATDYIVMMKQKNMKHRNDIDSLRQQSRVMEEQVHALERIKATSMYAQSTQGLLKPGGPDQTDTITAPPQTSVDTLQQATEQLIQSSELESADNDGGGEGEVIIEQVVEEYPEAMEGATT